MVPRGLRAAVRAADRGSFTAELAAGLPALVLFLLAGLTAVTAVTTKLQCVDAARDAALAASRGASGQDAARQHAPAGATVTIVTVAGQVRATVAAPVRPLGAHLPALEATATAVAALEPGSPGAEP